MFKVLVRLRDSLYEFVRGVEGVVGERIVDLSGRRVVLGEG